MSGKGGDLEGRVHGVLELCFAAAPGEISGATVQDDVPGWDSVGHLNLMLMIEESFGVRLEIEDMQKLTSVAAIVRFLGEAETGP